MNFKAILQDELRLKKILTINDVMKLCVIHNHYFDTARRHLEEDKTPFAKKEHGKKNRIKQWYYLQDEDNKIKQVSIW